jgi:hypothetical protein
MAKLRREAAATVPRRGLNPWEVLAGVACGAFAGAMHGALTYRSFDHGLFFTAAGALLGGLLLGLAGWRLWNQLLAQNLDALLMLLQGNLLDHGLLQLAIADELPAEFEQLRTVAQSYGKTRARNWNEIRKDSMRERVHWLVENYNVICKTLRLPRTVPTLDRLTRQVTWILALCWLPLIALFLLPIVFRKVGPQVWMAWLAPAFDLMNLALIGGIVVVWIIGRVERGALLKVLTEELQLGSKGASGGGGW